MFNNIFVQTERVPGVGFVGMKQAENVREGGNLIWGLKEGPTLQQDPVRQVPRVAAVQRKPQALRAGLDDARPRRRPEVRPHATDDSAPLDLSLQSDSPAVNSGLPLPPDWPDPLRDADRAEPDIGALPHGTQPWGVGVDGRLPLFGEMNQKTN